MTTATTDHPRRVQILIDRTHFNVSQDQMTSSELRNLPQPPIGRDRDLFQVVPSQPDRKVEDGDVIPLENGMRFFTAPGTINPGRA